MKITPPTLPPVLEQITDVNALLASDDMLTGFHLDGALFDASPGAMTSLSESLITKSELSHLSIERFDVLDCHFKGCNFTASKFPNSSWHQVTIDSSRCTGMQLTNSTIKNVVIANSKLELVNLRFSSFENVLFQDCVLSDVDFYNARLKNVEFSNCTIESITFANAKMVRVDLSSSQLEGSINGANLKGATISYDQLMQLAPTLASEAGIKVK